MSRSVLDLAQFLLKRRKFTRVISLLESRAEIYENDFEYFLTLGIACLYVGDVGNASAYFERAREIKLTNTTLLLGQAAIFLRRGQTDRALQYYLDILEHDPSNEHALAAMEFIRKNADYSTICRWVDTGKIERFYPPLGLNPDIIIKSVFSGLAIGFVVSMMIIFWPKSNVAIGTPRANIEELQLTKYEQQNPQEDDSQTPARYSMDDKEIKKSYQNALKCFQERRDNACQFEINRILNSNANVSIKQKARNLMSYLEEPTFDTVKDMYSYEQVSEAPELFLDCYVVWSGRVTNEKHYENGSYSCELLVDYEDGKNMSGHILITFDKEPEPPIDYERPVRFLARIDQEEKTLVLRGKSTYQPLKGKDLK